MSTKSNKEYSDFINTEDEIDLYQLWTVLVSRKRFIVIFCTLIVFLTAIVSLIMDPVYKAETTVIPISGKSSSLGQLSDLASLAGVSVKGDDDSTKIMAVLNSRTIKENVITRLDLIMKLLENKVPKKRNPMLAAIEVFEKQVSITSDKKTNVIKIEIQNEDPVLARDIANTYVSELKDILNTKSLTVNRMKREFLEHQLAMADSKLRGGQRNMVTYQKKTKMIQPVEQAKGTMGLYSELIAQKTALEIQYQSMEVALNPESPILKSLKSQLNIINSKLRQIEGEGDADIAALPSIGGAPDKMMRFADLTRDLETSKLIYGTLLKLYEQAKLEEAQEGIYVQVIDPPVVPDKKFKPKRGLMVIVAAFTSLFMAVFIVFFQEWLAGIRSEHSRR